MGIRVVVDRSSLVVGGSISLDRQLYLLEFGLATGGWRLKPV